MSHQFDEARLREHLDALGEDRRAAFAVACAERLLRGPAAAAAEHLHKSHALLDQLWAHLLGDYLPQERLAALARQAEHLVPHSEGADEWTPEQALAENALAALAYEVRTAVAGDSQSAVWAARQAIEALDFHAAEQLAAREYDPRTEQAIGTHPLVQAELRRQEADIRDLASRDTDADVLGVLRNRAQHDAAAFLGN